APRALDPAVVHAHLGTHGFEHLGEAHVALYALAPEAFDPHRAAAQRAGGEKVRGRGGVALDIDRARRRIARARNTKARPALALHPDTEAAHDVERDLHVRFRYQLAPHPD